MRKQVWSTILAVLVLVATAEVPFASEAGQAGRARGRGHENKTSRSQQEESGRARGNGNRIYQDPANAKGYDSGYDLGRTDGRDGQRYDPVRHRDYRDGDRGYASSYGSREGYRTNFRSGFRQGYEDGYREGTRTR
jgi:hypothetical protein